MDRATGSSESDSLKYRKVNERIAKARLFERRQSGRGVTMVAG